MNNRLATALLLALVLLSSPWAARAQVSIGISIGIPPPPLPVYVQPAMPAPGYLWTPGYWAWSPVDNDYYWVPGTWVRPPRVGVLWTPGYWAYVGGVYRWNPGYWGPRVGFYGGINYGFGYFGGGYAGGRWSGNAFHYNTAVNNIDTTVVRNVNVYNTKVVNVTNTRNVAFAGGPGGIDAKLARKQESIEPAKRIKPTPEQVEQEELARKAATQRASVNKGVPQVAATPKPRELNAPGVVKATNPQTVAAKDDQGDAAVSRGGARDAARDSATRKGNRPAASAEQAAGANQRGQRPTQRTGEVAGTSEQQRPSKAEREPKSVRPEPPSREGHDPGSAGRDSTPGPVGANVGGKQRMAGGGDPRGTRSSRQWAHPAAGQRQAHKPAPFARAPVPRLALGGHVAHRPDRLFDRLRRFGPAAAVDVDESPAPCA